MLGGIIMSDTTNNQDKQLAARREGLKLFFDVFKHLTTLSSGSILLLVAFLGKGGQQPLWRPLVALAFLGFLSSSVGAIVVMLSTARTIRRNETTDQLPDRIGGVGYYVAAIGFAVGVISLSLFAVRNL